MRTLLLPSLNKLQRVECDAGHNTLAIDLDFPIEQLTPVARLESWRKEIHRPTYHIHKWWANRLGSVFRTIVLAANLRDPETVWPAFYRRNDFSGIVVLDPFAGSGTTLGEALKLGCTVIGADINPVSYFLVRTALEEVDLDGLRDGFRRVEQAVASELKSFYRSVSPHSGEAVDVLYAFWVKLAQCASCGSQTRLFPSWIFATHAYPRRFPRCQVLCPTCGAVFESDYIQQHARCPECRYQFNPHAGPARRKTFVCERCGREQSILDSYRYAEGPPKHVLFALQLLEPDGARTYKRAEPGDLELYEKAERALMHTSFPLPTEEIPPGVNTDQARSYNYRFWRDMFNTRQLYCLGLLLREILREPDDRIRRHLLLLFSGSLEFNNLFCSFKGEGTGAVRPLFSHHILKPERVVLENNVWGTPKSSGSFSTLFERRLLPAKEYARNPFELMAGLHNGREASKKIFGVNRPIAGDLADSFAELASKRALVMHADAGSLPLPDKSVDLVITDPPYFNNVNYSELADFFYVWLRQGLTDHPAFLSATSRSCNEVQAQKPDDFLTALGRVWSECRRVLKPEGRLIFTFHHSDLNAWHAVEGSLRSAGFQAIQYHPIKAEMSVASPKAAAREPIDLDCVFVCKPDRSTPTDQENLEDIVATAKAKVVRLSKAGQKLSRGDLFVLLMGSATLHFGKLTQEGAIPAWQRLRLKVEKKIDGLAGAALGVDQPAIPYQPPLI